MDSILFAVVAIAAAALIIFAVTTRDNADENGSSDDRSGPTKR